MYLNAVKDVTRAHRPSASIFGMSETDLDLEENGATMLASVFDSATPTCAALCH